MLTVTGICRPTDPPLQHKLIESRPDWMCVPRAERLPVRPSLLVPLTTSRTVLMVLYRGALNVGRTGSHAPEALWAAQAQKICADDTTGEINADRGSVIISGE